MSNENEMYVNAVLTHSVVISCKDKCKNKFLKKNHARRRWFNRTIWDIEYESKEDLARIFYIFNQEGVPFSADQHGWGPAETFEHLREEGYIEGSFKEISWSGPGKFIVRIK